MKKYNNFINEEINININTPYGDIVEILKNVKYKEFKLGELKFNIDNSYDDYFSILNHDNGNISYYDKNEEGYEKAVHYLENYEAEIYQNKNKDKNKDNCEGELKEEIEKITDFLLNLLENGATINNGVGSDSGVVYCKGEFFHDHITTTEQDFIFRGLNLDEQIKKVGGIDKNKYYTWGLGSINTPLEIVTINDIKNHLCRHMIEGNKADFIRDECFKGNSMKEFFEKSLESKAEYLEWYLNL